MKAKFIEDADERHLRRGDVDHGDEAFHDLSRSFARARTLEAFTDQASAPSAARHRRLVRPR